MAKCSCLGPNPFLSSLGPWGSGSVQWCMGSTLTTLQGSDSRTATCTSWRWPGGGLPFPPHPTGEEALPVPRASLLCCWHPTRNDKHKLLGLLYSIKMQTTSLSSVTSLTHTYNTKPSLDTHSSHQALAMAIPLDHPGTGSGHKASSVMEPMLCLHQVLGSVLSILI